MLNAEINEKEFKNVKYIVVHGGKVAHQDEEVACAIAWAAGARDVDIERREPTDDEIWDPNVLVMDVGMAYLPNVNTFDHHDRSRDDEPKCAYCLLAEHLGIREFLGQVFKWFEPGILIDVIGPYAASAKLGFDWNLAQGLVVNPGAGFHHTQWVNDPQYRRKYSEYLGQRILDAIDGWRQYEALSVPSYEGELKVLDITCVPERYSWMSEAYATAEGANVIVFNDDRGEGLGLLRLHDDPRIDFSKLEGDPKVNFAHKGGFILKTKSKDDGFVDFVRRALV